MCRDDAITLRVSYPFSVDFSKNLNSDDKKKGIYSIRDFEPKKALVGGETGLEFYERLAQELPKYLYPSAKVFLEIGYNQVKH